MGEPGGNNFGKWLPAVRFSFPKLLPPGSPIARQLLLVLDP